MISRTRWDAVSTAFRIPVNSSFTDYAATTRSTARIEAERRAAQEQLQVAIQATSGFEAKMGLMRPWSECDPEYQATLKYIQQREYHRALDKLQRLVIQRLFELSKANVIGMGKLLRFLLPTSTNTVLYRL